MVRTTAVGQPESTLGTVGSESSVNGVSGTNACDMSTCSEGANIPINSCKDNVNALSVLVPNGCTDMTELSLPKFSNSAKQVLAHFLRELNDTLHSRKHQMNLNLRFALGPSRTLLPNSGSRQFMTLSGHKKTLRQRS
jgi:hypothetical protein